jgi:integrase
MPELDIALNTGMRSSEQYLRIDWPCVDFLRRHLYVPKSKNGEARHIPLNPEALAAFQVLFACTGGKGPIFTAHKPGPKPKNFIRESDRSGKRLLDARDWFETAVRKAGIESFTWHCLRQSFASRLVMAGVDLRTVAELMEHKKIQMTMRYALLAQGHKESALDKLAERNRIEKVAPSQNAESPAILTSPAGDRTGTRTGTEEKRAVQTASSNIQ